MKRRSRPEEVTHGGGGAFGTQGTFHTSSTMNKAFSSNALPDCWRQTWSEAGAFPSPTLRRPDEVVSPRPERDLSTPARRANHQAERKMQQYASAQQLTMSRTSAAGFDTEAGQAGAQTNRTLSTMNVPSAAFLASHKEREEAFKTSAAEVDNLIQSLGASIRLEGVKNSKQRDMDRLNKEREEAKRRLKEQERLGREREAAARDPHRKVDLKVENTRKFGMALVEEMKVPMQQVDFATDGGVEQINMVDILQIRQKCKRCDTRATPSVEVLIDDQARRDRLLGNDPKTGKRRNGASVMTTSQSKLASTGQSALGSRAQLPMAMTEGKQAKLNSRKSMFFMANMLQKLNTMRVQPPEATLYNLEQIAHQAHRDVAIERSHSNIEIKVQKKTTFLQVEGLSGDTINPVLMERARTPLQTPRAIIRSSRKTVPVKQVVSPCSRKSLKTVTCDPKVQERARKALLIFRYAVSAQVLWSMALKKRNATYIMKNFLSTIGEWARMRSSMTKLRTNITILQRGSRQFLALKRKRCEIMLREWQRVEDRGLAVHFNALAEKSIEDLKKAAVEAKAGPEGTIKHMMAMQNKNNDKTTNAIAKMMKDQVDWKIYRIPVKQRKAVASRYYMVQLKKKVNGNRHILTVVQEVVQAHRDTLGFLGEFGADASQANDLKNMATAQNKDPTHAAEFWQLSEETMLGLIAFAAHQLGLKSAEPWRNHPANQEITGMHNPMYRPELKGHSANGNDFLGMMGERRRDNSNNGASRASIFTHGAADIPITQKHEEKKAVRPADIDDLWSSFTPRLRDSSNRPLSRMATDRPASRPGLGEQDQAEWRLTWDSGQAAAH